VVITYTILHQRLVDYLLFLRGSDFILWNFNSILFKTGLRVRELHTYTRWEINPDDTLTCITEKGSNPRIFQPSDLTPYFIQHIEEGNDPWKYNSYDTINLYFLRCSNLGYVKVHTKSLSLSLYRHHFCKYLHELSYSDEAIQALMGEKDINNTRGYIYSDLYE
jgi:site-specific recombinase XerD